jgi:hypothetical protein
MDVAVYAGVCVTSMIVNYSIYAHPCIDLSIHPSISTIPRGRALNLLRNSIRPRDLLLGRGGQVELLRIQVLIERAAHIEESLVGLELVPVRHSLALGVQRGARTYEGVSTAVTSVTAIYD